MSCQDMGLLLSAIGPDSMTGGGGLVSRMVGFSIVGDYLWVKGGSYTRRYTVFCYQNY